jgi:rhamnosyltransferase subunit B
MSGTIPHYPLITVGTTGDVHPFMHMAKTLQDLRRKVRLITNSYHARLVQGAGLAFVGKNK